MDFKQLNLLAQGLLHHWAYLSSLCWTVVLGLDLWNGM